MLRGNAEGECREVLVEGACRESRGVETTVRVALSGSMIVLSSDTHTNALTANIVFALKIQSKCNYGVRTSIESTTKLHQPLYLWYT